MNPTVKDILLGPQLIGVLYILIGATRRYFPPKSPNRWYGHRTITAKTSQQTWDEANRYSAIYMMRAGAIVLLLGTIVYSGILYMHVEDSTQKIIDYTILFGTAMGIGILSTVATERHLARTFKKLNKPNRQSSITKRK